MTERRRRRRRRYLCMAIASPTSRAASTSADRRSVATFVGTPAAGGARPQTRSGNTDSLERGGSRPTSTTPWAPALPVARAPSRVPSADGYVGRDPATYPVFDQHEVATNKNCAKETVTISARQH